MTFFCSALVAPCADGVPGNPGNISAAMRSHRSAGTPAAPFALQINPQPRPRLSRSGSLSAPLQCCLALEGCHRGREDRGRAGDTWQRWEVAVILASPPPKLGGEEEEGALGGRGSTWLLAG